MVEPIVCDICGRTVNGKYEISIRMFKRKLNATISQDVFISEDACEACFDKIFSAYKGIKKDA